MEDEVGLVGSAEGSLADPYDMAMAQMQAHMLVAEDGDDMHSLDAASGHSDEELRIIMDAESRTGFVPVLALAAAPAPKVPRSAATSRGRSSGRPVTGQRPDPVQGVRGNKENKSRARPRKPHEPDPFLSIDTMPTEKVHRQSTPSHERSVSAQEGSSVAVRKKLDSSGRQTKAPPGTPSHPVFHAPSNRSRMSRNASSAVSSEWNPIVPRQKPLSGHALEHPVNRHVKQPFKHNVNKPDMDKALRPMSPSQTMKERTMLATFHLARTMARQHGEEEDKLGGRLLKGRLKPLYPVRVEGPSIHHCKGVVAEENPLTNSDSRTLARRRKIMSGMLSKDFLFERPPTAESLHHTSVASDLSEGREKDLDDMVVDQEKHPALPTPPYDGWREPPNSLASASDPNFGHTLNPTSASGLSSDVFEIDEIPKTMHTEQLPHQHTIEEVSVPSTAHDDKQRPNTAKTVHFADNDKPIVEASDTAVDEEKDKDTDNKAEQSTDGCRRLTDIPPKKEPDDDPDNQGRGPSQDRPGPSNEQTHGSQGQTEGQTQDSSQGQSSDQGQTGGTQDSSGTRDDVASDPSDSNHTMKMSYTTVLYTSDEVKFHRMGTVLPPKPNKSKKKSKTKPVQIKLSSKSEENMSNISVEGGGRESPTKDFYDKFAKKSQSAAPTIRPQTAGATDTSKKPLLLRRPISASIPVKDAQVQFVVGPGADSGVSEQDRLPTNSPRLNEMRSQMPISARTQTSGVPSTTRDYSMEPTVARVKPKEPERDFKVEGSKMSQAIRAGLCTECGKSTTKIAEYWEETGALVCDVCNRRTRAEEERKIEWIRKQMNNVYTGECDKEGNPTEALNMVTEFGEIGGVNNLDDLEKALNAVHCEINEAIRDVHDEALWISEDEDSEDEELLALTYGEDTLEKPEQEAALDTHLHGTSPRTVLDEDPEKITAGQISRILTEINADPASLSDYEMRVYWYQEYCRNRERDKREGKGLGKERRQKRQVSAGGQVYEALQEETGHQADGGDTSSYKMTLMAEQNLDPVTEMLQQGMPPAPTPAGGVQHFKGQRVSKVQGELVDDTLTDEGNLGVSGRAKKLLRNPSAKKPAPQALAPFAPLCFRINARPPPNYLYYFAYGADMNPDRMAMYLQRPVAGGRLWGLLYGFQLVFNKRGVDEEAGAFPNIQLETGASVEGCLYLITLEELDKVDRQVGYPQHYDHAMLPVWLLNCTEPEQYGVAQYCVPALVYVANDEWIQKGGSQLPTDYAIQQCMKGGGDVLSAAYRDHLTALTVS